MTYRLVGFDLDGTLCDNTHRVHYVRSKPKNWPAFEAGILGDSLIEKVGFFAAQFMGDPKVDVIITTARNEGQREACEQWLRMHNLDQYAKMYMRKQHIVNDKGKSVRDYRCDSIVKKEILDDIVADWGQKPDLIFDDRDRVVKMWRENDVTCFQVANGDF